MGFGALAPVDRFLERHRIPVIARRSARSCSARRSSPCCPSTSIRSTCKTRRPSRSPPSSNCAGIRRPGRMRSRSWRPTCNRPSKPAARLAALPEVARHDDPRQLGPGRPGRKAAAIGRAAASLEPALDPDAEGAAERRGECRGADLDRRRRCRNSPGRTPAPAARRRGASSALLPRLAKAEPGGARAGRSGSRRAAARVACRRSRPRCTRAGHDCDLAGRAEARLAGAGRRGAGAGPAEGRPRRHRGAARFRHRGDGGRTRRDRPGRADVRSRQHDRARLHRSRGLRARRHRVLLWITLRRVGDVP